ncbi:MAG: ribonuclease III [Candidatus Vogelbacteria bacterium CG10_big_fil_rev_8_21_14_0_10_51_16]|uniref:Ribonuclease 3 n=1 Tax=Candidatus Vogelbacteria bacterium CG10_big_fil_rev_8_21_14_0_10_51_16 TaxID=1975045 RepID=A0A2H0RFG9_9BACT|nr:MAG: ribonuclease III [Candidatus Vogelbacteria bacterium CG10_big_fil_rev_8_21_14_0_10_51_16]
MELPDFAQFARLINASFKNKDLLVQAFTHRSYLNENQSFGLGHNERLEFLGDAVLELVITEYLYSEYPHKQEGELTSYRAALVNTISISEAARELHMDNFLLLSRGEAKDTGRARQSILANTFESVIGAIYLDQGYQSAKEFILAQLVPKLEGIVKKQLWRDSKSFFQEKAQEFDGITPSYQLLSETGPDHEKQFTVGLFIGNKKVAEGNGHSKQEAEQDAAERGLTARGWGR